MQTISEAIYELLMVQGIEAGRLAGRERHGMKSPALSTMASSGEVVADAAGGLHRPTAGGGIQPMGMGKTERTKRPASALERQEREPTPANRRVLLTVVASNKCLPRATPMRGPRNALGRHLVLV